MHFDRLQISYILRKTKSLLQKVTNLRAQYRSGRYCDTESPRTMGSKRLSRVQETRVQDYLCLSGPTSELKLAWCEVSVG
jgi:hypothetical protein